MSNLQTPTSLNGLESITDFTYMEMLEKNLNTFFDWGLINANGFMNVNIPASGTYGGDFSRLRPVDDERFNDGTVWEAARMNWVWETGLASSIPPISPISGLFINNTFYPVSGNTYYIDYPNGKVVFNNSIALNSVVKIEHSSKFVNVTSTQNIPWLRLAQNDSFRIDDTDFLSGSGLWSNYGETRIQLPTIAIEVLTGKKQGFQIGGGQYTRNRVNFFVIGEDKATVDRLANIIDNQREKTIYLYDSNKMASDGKFPLNQFGTPNSGFLTYPALVQYSGDGGYRLTRGVLWGKLSFIDSEVQERQQIMQNIYQRSVVLTTEAVLTNIT